jgi:hypothetical protein
MRSVRSQSLPVVHQGWFGSEGYHDPGLKPSEANPGIAKWVDAIRSGGLVIVSTDYWDESGQPIRTLRGHLRSRRRRVSAERQLRFRLVKRYKKAA